MFRIQNPEEEDFVGNTYEKFSNPPKPWVVSREQVILRSPFAKSLTSIGVPKEEIASSPKVRAIREARSGTRAYCGEGLIADNILCETLIRHLPNLREMLRGGPDAIQAYLIF